MTDGEDEDDEYGIYGDGGHDDDNREYDYDGANNDEDSDDYENRRKSTSSYKVALPKSQKKFGSVRGGNQESRTHKPAPDMAAKLFDELSCFGFGFVELGQVI